MEITVAQRAHRKLKRCPRYRSFAALDGASRELLARVPVGADEAPIGLYENVTGSDEGCLVITDRGLHILRRDGGRFMSYDEMASAELEAGAKSADHLTIRLRSGAMGLVPVSGEDASTGTRDTFALLMFLDSVIADLDRCRERGLHALEQTRVAS